MRIFELLRVLPKLVKDFGTSPLALHEFSAFLGVTGDVTELTALLAAVDANPDSGDLPGVHSLRWVLFQPSLDNDDPREAFEEAEYALVLSFVCDGEVNESVEEVAALRSTQDILAYCHAYDEAEPARYLNQRRVKSGFMFRDLGPLRAPTSPDDRPYDVDATRAEIDRAVRVQEHFESFYARSEGGKLPGLQARFLEEFRQYAFPFPPTPFERYLTDEYRWSRRMSEIIRRGQATVARATKSSFLRRGAHAKGHGFLRGTFHIEKGVPSTLAHGIFAARGKTFPLRARLSNGQPKVLSDRKGDVRGLALGIQLPFGPDGWDKSDFLFPDGQGDTGRQDFILNSDPEFFAANIREAVHIFGIVAQDPWPLQLTRGLVFAATTGATKQLKLAFRAMKGRVAHPLKPTFHSATPYLLGDDHVVKYSVEVDDPERFATLKMGESMNFLRTALRGSLDGADITLKFFVHSLSLAGRNPEAIKNIVEDATMNWEPLGAQKCHVATLRFPAQDPTTAEALNEAEHWRFDLWSALKAHRPIGSINRGRLVIYANSAQFRSRSANVHRLFGDHSPRPKSASGERHAAE